MIAKEKRQAFLDYYNHVYKKLKNEKERMKLGISEDEIGKIQSLSFNIIRLREFHDIGKVHQIIRDIPKWLANPVAKKELYTIAHIKPKIDESQGLDEASKDARWAGKDKNQIIRSVVVAKDAYSQEKSKVTPIELLDDALKKLMHENMDIKGIRSKDIPLANNLLKDPSKN